MLKLLVADDERILREAVCYLIDWKSIGIELAASCKNGREAYEEACRTKPDIILTDIKMPGLSGLDLVEKLSEPGRVLEFILLTGYADFEYAHRALSTGCTTICLSLATNSRSLKRYSRRHSPSTRAASCSKWSRPVRVWRALNTARRCKRSWTIWKSTTATPRCHSKAWRPITCL